MSELDYEVYRRQDDFEDENPSRRPRMETPIGPPLAMEDLGVNDPMDIPVDGVAFPPYTYKPKRRPYRLYRRLNALRRRNYYLARRQRMYRRRAMLNRRRTYRRPSRRYTRGSRVYNIM